ncbi:uncharacterized protein (DUF924 family) [Altererythrobacter atlanticus]|uniref:Uncharacterized protein n=1 Tax=Croceibacterium atlanticum TaxID=1267766 RepID=A0A0F7KV64_9SPHN|nr:DUF924 family protein [Croceibacterium atlanticum]AKH43071.1 hypothetical protein WYH_02037 [Croceibacterium atlanticum]MBB5732226.1 uncharacterized protein (DUF924 family) [Croceibacterium atlanticum]
MAAPRRRWAAEILHFWFQTLGPADWFGGGEHVDIALKRRFSRELAMLWPRPAHEFLADRQTALAAILLFDQVPRNLHRGTRHAFTFDPLARTITRGALMRGWDRGMGLHQRQFLAMPLMHSEHIGDQIWSLRYYTDLGNATIRRFAVDHYRMIARFGRFPHRNEMLGRESSPAELRAIAAGNHW